jgi:hypothetical protein
MERVREVLLSFSFLCWRGKEYGGFINLRTGEVEGPWEGEEGRISIPLGSLEEIRAKARQGWAWWHTHPAGADVMLSGPSAADLIIAHVAGGPTYIVTEWGVWEVLPLRTFSLERLQNRLYLARKEAREEAARLGYGEGDIDVPCPCCGESLFFKCLKRRLPVRISLL